MENTILIYSAIFLYLTCAALLFFNKKKSSDGGLSKKQILLIGFAALILHSVALTNNLVTDTGINLAFYNSLSLISAFIVLFTLISTWRHPIEILLISLLPIASITLQLDIYNSTTQVHEIGDSKGLIFHILTSIIAYSVLALAALQAVLLWIQNKFLHAHQPGGIIKLMPPLRNMEALLFESIVVGFVTLTVSLGSGLIFLENMFAQQLAHKTILSILAWFVFLILLIGHWKLGWRGKVAIRWTLGGFISLMLAYFGSKFVLEIVLA